jgi:outer membrane protein TolC
MNRLIFFTMLMVLVSPCIFAQKTPGVTPPARKTIPAALPSDTIIENRLVALALNGPEYEASIHQNKIDELRLKAVKATWLNLLSFSLQLNDQSFKQQQTVGQVAYVYPKYFFGLTIPLGLFFSQGNSVKQARESLLYAHDQQQLLAVQIRANVLSKYRQYREYDDLVRMEEELSNDVLAISAQAEDNFKNGTITVESYIAAQRAKNEEMSKLMNLRLQQDLLKIDLERMIGVPLDDVLHPRKRG